MDLYYCGFTALRETQKSDTWEKTPDIHPGDASCIALSWESLYTVDGKGDILENGAPIDPQLDLHNHKLVMLSAAEDRLAVLAADGAVQLRVGNRWRQLRLQADSARPPGTVSCLSVGRRTLAACDSEGVLWTLDAVPTPAGEHVTSVSCGREHVMLLTRSGRVYTYGGGSRGQLGTGELVSCEQPQLVEALDGVPIHQVAAGGWHSAVLSVSGDVYSWGWNQAGQLGLPPEVTVSAEPQLLENIPDVKQLACGSRHTLGLTDDGSVYGWGWSGHGQLASADGREQLPPRPLQLPLPGAAVASVAAGGWSSALLVAPPAGSGVTS